jgi:cell wall-associated NlpC family hydrolase
MKAASTYNVNPIYLVMHSNLEGGKGTSKLATGTVPGYTGYYNVYGVGAYDGSADTSGAKFAKQQGWDSIDKAIEGGAKFVAQNYIAKGQDTLYRMRWNPANPGTHQYATDIAWASKIASTMATLVKEMGIAMSNLPTSLSSYKDNTAFTQGANQGEKIITEAKKHLGDDYVWGGNGPDEFDCSGFVKYVYKEAIGYDMKNRTALTQWQYEGREVTDFYKAGDLVFFAGTDNNGRMKSSGVPNITHVGIALGEGDQFIQASGTREKGGDVNISSLSNSYWKKYFYGRKRLLDDSETYTDEANLAEYRSPSAPDTLTGLAGGLPLTQVSDYQDELEDALEQLRSSEDTTCTIIDLKYGGEFRFMMPETVTENVPVSWDNSANIRGRSVPPVGYSSTGPRSISFEIILVAGAGYYARRDPDGNRVRGDLVGKMYQDINFVKSLEYPDYSKALLETPPIVLLSMGPNIKMRGVVNSLNITYEGAKDEYNRYMKAILSISISQVSDEPPGLYDMREGTMRSY